MTFKHAKFEDSTVMKSLERLAQVKGLIKNDPIKKEASAPKKLDLSPTDNLTENLMKLCAGLKESGLETYSEDLASAFVLYKQARLYDAEEKGEDLVNAAHPKGSHKLSDVDGDAIIETILDQQLKDLKIVNKKPTGKLSSANDIINAVKVVFAQNSSQTLAQQAQNEINKLPHLARKIRSIADKELTFTTLPWQTIIEEYSNNAVLDNLNYLKNLWRRFKNRIRPGIPLTGGVTEDTWISLESLFNQGYVIIDKAIKLRTEAQKTLSEERRVEEQTSKITSPAASDFLNKINNTLNIITDYKTKINSDTSITNDEKSAAIEWLNKQVTKIDNLNHEFHLIPEESREEKIALLDSNLNKIIELLGKFKEKWI